MILLYYANYVVPAHGQWCILMAIDAQRCAVTINQSSFGYANFVEPGKQVQGDRAASGLKEEIPASRTNVVHPEANGPRSSKRSLSFSPPHPHPHPHPHPRPRPHPTSLSTSTPRFPTNTTGTGTTTTITTTITNTINMITIEHRYDRYNDGHLKELAAK
ncbi:hypothetical protein M0802_004570 [Mischocyttarus mexicanus]|nr:hypothetical protein M0802_004570 [Mischocyttarus mexicanus]